MGKARRGLVEFDSRSRKKDADENQSPPRLGCSKYIKTNTHTKKRGPSTGVREGFSVGMMLKPRAGSGEWGAEEERPSHFLLVWKVGVKKNENSKS